MSDTSKRVLERSQTGEYEFTPYGEFLSYYHAHLQIFNKFIELNTDKLVVVLTYTKFTPYLIKKYDPKYNILLS